MKMHFTIQTDENTKKINHAMLERVQYLLTYASLDKSFWAEALVYASHLMNRLSSTAIGGKTLLDIWSSGAAQDYSLLSVFGCPAYFHVKERKLDPRAKKFAFLSVKKIFEKL